MDSHLAGWPGWAPFCRLPSGHSAPHLPRGTEPRSPQSRVTFALSERALHLGRRRGRPRSHGSGTQRCRLPWLRRLKLQSTAVGDSGTAGRAAPAPGSRWCHRRKQRGTAESREAWQLPAPRQRGSAREGRQASAGAEGTGRTQGTPAHAT